MGILIGIALNHRLLWVKYGHFNNTNSSSPKSMGYLSVLYNFFQFSWSVFYSFQSIGFSPPWLVCSQVFYSFGGILNGIFKTFSDDFIAL